MKHMSFLLITTLLMACNPAFDTGWSIDQVPDDPIPEPVLVDAKAPLYWTVYEYCFEAEHAHQNTNMPKNIWEANIEWVEKNLLPYGYNMIVTDGFMSMHSDLSVNSQGYMTHYGVYSLKELVALCNAHNLQLGIYDNPLWLHASLQVNPVIDGTNIHVSSLIYDPSIDHVLHPEESAAENEWFTWIVPSHPGAKEYIDGFFKYYASIGVHYIRMDFMSVFEDGTGHGTKNPARGYGREEYALALQYIQESAARYGVFTSIVMPHCYEHAELEARYCNMMRTEADVFCGHWAAFSGLENEYFDVYGDATYYRHRGDVGGSWPQCNNVFDGFVHFSDKAGRGKVIMDGDFTRLTTLSSDDEARSVISLQLVAGGPVACADQFNSANIDHYLPFYQNDELLALNRDGFVGQPLSRDLNSPDSQIWYGQMSDGDWIVALFNREPLEQQRSFGFLGHLPLAEYKVRDLWEHQDMGSASSVSALIPSHGCKVYRLTVNK